MNITHLAAHSNNTMPIIPCISFIGLGIHSHEHSHTSRFWPDHHHSHARPPVRTPHVIKLGVTTLTPPLYTHFCCCTTSHLRITSTSLCLSRCSLSPSSCFLRRVWHRRPSAQKCSTTQKWSLQDQYYYAQ